MLFSMNSSVDYNEIEIDDLRLPFVCDELPENVELDEKSYEIDASNKEGNY